MSGLFLSMLGLNSPSWVSTSIVWGISDGNFASMSFYFSMPTSILSFWIISSISLGDLWILDIALFLIVFTRYANFKDCTLSSLNLTNRLHVHSKVVLEFPPRLSFKRCVNFESRNGTYGSPLDRDLITRPSDVKLWLIFFASSSILPVAPLCPILSEPAKSTRFNLADFYEPSLFNCLYSRTSMVWLLELLSFRPVLSICTLFCPICIHWKISCGL